MENPKVHPSIHGSHQAGNGIGSLQNPRKFKNQDFHSLREYHLSRGLRFKDDTFPADISIIGPELESEFKIRNIEWKRPKDICEDPHLFVDGISLFDICQSKLGDCWVLASMGCLTLKENFLMNVLPLNQGFRSKYVGIFHFRFWYFGEWVDVVIDDKLPFLNGEYLSARPCKRNEFWPCLLEKAYAKLQGSYQRLHWGNICEAFVNFSGGVAVEFDLKDVRMPPSQLWGIVNAANLNALIGCFALQQSVPSLQRNFSVPEKETPYRDDRRRSAPAQQIHVNFELKNGLVQGHAYTVTDTVQVDYKNRLEYLIRMWNPWGHGEWTGRWSDGSEQWNHVKPDVRRKLHKSLNNGEFWMSWQDFIREFSCIIICNQSPHFLDVEDKKSRWKMSTYFSRWVKGSTAGGSLTFHTDTFSRNPQYLIEVTQSDGLQGGHNVVVALMQSPANRKMSSTDWLPIGFRICKVDPQYQGQKNTLPQTFFSQCESTAINTNFQNKCEVTKSIQLPAGTYVIVPSTLHEGQESDFLLRIYMKSKCCAEELRTKLTLNSPVGQKVNASHLQKLLNERFLKDCPGKLKGGGFTEDECRGILALMDSNHNGTLDLEDSSRLWRYLNAFKDVFQQVDVNQMEFLDLDGLRKAIQASGLEASSEVIKLMVLRYGDSSKRLNFTSFLCCMIRLKITTKAFQILNKDGKGMHMTQEKWLQLFMYS